MVSQAAATGTPAVPGLESAKQYIRLGGFALFLGGITWGVGEVIWGVKVMADDPRDYPQPTATIVWMVILLAFTAIALGLPALHALQARKAGALGVIGFIVLFVGTTLMLGLINFGAFYQAVVFGFVKEAEAAGVVVNEATLPDVAYLAAYGLHALGWLLFGGAALRARVLPRWPVVTVMVGALLMSPIAFRFPPLLAAGIAWLGVVLIRTTRTQAAFESAQQQVPQIAT